MRTTRTERGRIECSIEGGWESGRKEKAKKKKKKKKSKKKKKKNVRTFENNKIICTKLYFVLPEWKLKSK